MEGSTGLPPPAPDDQRDPMPAHLCLPLPVRSRGYPLLNDHLSKFGPMARPGRWARQDAQLVRVCRKGGMKSGNTTACMNTFTVWLLLAPILVHSPPPPFSSIHPSFLSRLPSISSCFRPLPIPKNSAIVMPTPRPGSPTFYGVVLRGVSLVFVGSRPG